MKLLLHALIIICGSAISTPSFSQGSLQAQWLAQTNLPLSTGTITITDAAKTASDETYIIGRFTNGADFDTGPDTFYVRAPYGNAQFLAKYNKAGKLVFAEGLSGYGEQSYYNFSSVATDNNNNVYITGRYARYLDFDPGPGFDSLPTSNYYDQRMFIAKYSPAGALVWTKPVYSQNDKSFSTAIAADAQGNICITGSLYGSMNDFDPGPGSVALKASQEGDIFFATYNTNGEYISAQLISGNGGSYTTDVTMDNGSNILITGTYAKTVDFDPGTDSAKLKAQGNGDIFIAKYTLAGSYLFAKSIGGKGADNTNQILTDNKNNIFLAGSFSGINTDFDPGARKVLRSAAGSSNADVFTEKLDSSGNYVWVHTAGGTASDYNTSIAVDNNGNTYTLGYVLGNDILFPNTSAPDTLPAVKGSGLYFAKYNNVGTCTYVKQVENTGSAYAGKIFVSAQNNIILAGNFSDSLDLNPAAKKSILYSTYNTLFFGNYSSSGQYLAGSKVDLYGLFTDDSQLYKVTGDKKGNTYVIGQFQGITDFEPGPPDTTLITSATGYYKNGFTTSTGDKFFAKYDAGGKLQFIKTIPATYDNNMNNITVDEDENIYICGGYGGKVNFSPGSDTAIFGANDQYKFFGYFVKYDKNGNYVFAKNIKMLGGFASIAIDKKKNIYVAGNFSNKANFNELDSNAVLTAIGGTDLFFGKYDSAGNYIYIKHIGQKGNKNNAGATDMKITPSGRMIICGELIGDKTDFDPGEDTYFLSSGKAYDAYFIAAYTLQGNFLFASAADSASTGSSYAQQLVLDGENVVISGYYRGAVDLDPGPKVSEQPNGINLASNFFLKINSMGKLFFTHAFIPTKFVDGSSNNTITGIGVDGTHRIYIAGFYTVETDFDFGEETALKDSGGSYLATYDSLGNYEYVQDFVSYAPYGGYAFNYATALWIGNQNEIVLAGDATGNLDLDPGAGSLIFHAPVYVHFAFYLAKYKDTGSLQKPPVLFSLASQFFSIP